MANRYLGQIADFFRRLTAGQVAAMFLLVVLVVGSILGVVYYMRRVEYTTLYAGLSPEDANAVVAKLREQRVDFRLEDDGRTVKVPADRANELRITLAGSGAPIGGGIGFEIFDKTNFGVTDFVQQVNYKRALEGELSRTITSLSEVAQARVHLVLPKATVFATEESEGKASVVVKLRMGKSLSQGAVAGIVNLVASSVDSLRPESVTVVDEYGRLLSRPTAGDAAEALTDAQQRLRADVEKQLAGKIVSILEPIVGEGRVRANITAELNFDKVEETEEKYDPATTVLRSQQKSTETSGPQSAGGAAGVQSNQPTGATLTTPQGGQSTFQRQTETANYEISKTVRHRVDTYGGLKKVSAAVIVDDQMKNEKDKKGVMQTTFAPRTPEDLKKYRDIVAAAIAIDPARGDAITVENLTFGVRTEMVPFEGPSFWEQYSGYMLPLVKYLAFLILFLLIYRLVIKPATARFYVDVLGSIGSGGGAMMLPAGAAMGGEGGELAEGAPPRALPRRVGDIEAELESEVESELAMPTKEGRKGAILKRRIGESVTKEPQAAAQLVKTWLAEDKRAKRRI